jgi:hypothetical protein
MKARYSVVCFFFIAIVFSIVYCTDAGQSEEEKVARSYCSSCHLFPEPSMLDKATWTKGVLPKMAEYLGIAYLGNTYFVNSMDVNRKPNDTIQPAISYQNWSAIVNYYTTNAPEKMDSQSRLKIEQITTRFVTKEQVVKGRRPSTTYVQIDPGNKRIYTSSEADSVFSVFDADLNLISGKNIHKVLVDAHFTENLKTAGTRSGVATNIGIMYPNDLNTGTLEQFQIDDRSNFNISSTISSKIPRPVQATAADFDNDGKTDYLVCGFGHKNGAFYYLHQIDSNRYEKKMLNPIPGAIKAYIEDYNKDGLQDIVVLFAQAQEGIYLYLNKGGGNFEAKELLRFPSVYGSSFFEMVDVNKDGLKDFVYTCGDNYDFSIVLKNYHGVYIFLNKGNDKYEQAYFFPIHGCYKALMRDFDNDGDLDIAAISYFPDVKNQPQEALVYLENKGGLKFAPTAIKGFDRGNWVTMDAGDVDGDGDEDIVVGSLILGRSPRELTSKIAPNEMPSFLLLVNQTK